MRQSLISAILAKLSSIGSKLISMDNLLIKILLVLAMLSSFFNEPKFSYIDWHVIALLFNLMVVVAVFQQYNLLEWIAVKILSYANNERSLTRIMLLLCMIGGMLITNDVVLITFVPITILISLKVNINSIRLIVLQTLAANLGSSFTPLGNPQNLFLYSYYHYTWLLFLQQTSILLIISMIFLWWISTFIETNPFSLDLELPKLVRPWIIFLFFILFLLVLASVGELINYRIVTLIIAIISLVLMPKIIRDLDYSLLVTFILFFVVVGNIMHIPFIANNMGHLLSGAWASFGSAIILSQFISNVPTAIMLSSFTHFKLALIWGVNVGGMGTMIASMASLISYRIYLQHSTSDANGYLRVYLKYNVLGMIVFIPLCMMMIYLFNL